MSSKRQLSKRYRYHKGQVAIRRDLTRSISAIPGDNGINLPAEESEPVRGERIRVSRSMKDPTEVGKIAMSLERLHRDGIIKWKAPSKMALTVFDMANYPQPLKHNHSEESVETLLKRGVPSLFKPFSADIKGLGLFGHREHPCIGLTFKTGFLDIESAEVTRTLFPGLKLSRMASHLTVARAFSRGRAMATIGTLEEYLPSQVMFNVGKIAVGLGERTYS